MCLFCARDFKGTELNRPISSNCYASSGAETDYANGMAVRRYILHV